MRLSAFFVAGIGLFAAGAFADENPFMKPEIRKPAPKVSVPMIDHNGMTVDPSIAEISNGGVVNAQLIAVINGEEVWLTDNDKTYVRQKERDNSRLRLQEVTPDIAAGSSELTIVSAGRPSPANAPR
jgi:hypothetical protein